MLVRINSIIWNMYTQGGKNEEISKPNYVVQYKHMKCVDRADQYLSYYSILRKTVKWSKKILFLLNCALFNSFLMYKTLNKGTREQKYK